MSTQNTSETTPLLTLWDRQIMAATSAQLEGLYALREHHLKGEEALALLAAQTTRLTEMLALSASKAEVLEAEVKRLHAVIDAADKSIKRWKDRAISKD